MTAAIVHGLLLSLGLILPLGAQNTFVFTQGATHRRWARALPVVVTASLCDTLLIILAVSGVSVAVLAVPGFQTLLSWVGVAFLAYVGWVTWRSPASAVDPAVAGARAEWPLRRQVLFSMSVSLLNPHAILDTVGVIGTSSLAYSGAALAAYTAACVAVSWLWFLGLATAGHLAGTVNPNGAWRSWLNRISALVMWGVGGQLLLRLIG